MLDFIITNYIKAHLGLKLYNSRAGKQVRNYNKLYQSSSWFETSDMLSLPLKTTNNKLYQSSSWFETQLLAFPELLLANNKLYQSSSWFETKKTIKVRKELKK